MRDVNVKTNEQDVDMKQWLNTRLVIFKTFIRKFNYILGELNALTSTQLDEEFVFNSRRQRKKKIYSNKFR